MSWSEYYQQTHPESFCQQFGQDVLNRVFDHYLDCPDQPLNLLLGGFSPQSSTAQSFIDHCRHLHSNLNDQIILLDKNSQPFQKGRFTKKGNISCLQANLTNLPFKNHSLDLIFLDGTTMFMTNKEIDQFSQEAQRVLTNRGLVIACFSAPLLDSLIPFKNVLAQIANHTRVYLRSEQQTQTLFPHLKEIVAYDYRGDTALIFARPSHQAPAFSGQNYCLENLT